jgi:hypothetical protein
MSNIVNPPQLTKRGRVNPGAALLKRAKGFFKRLQGSSRLRGLFVRNRFQNDKDKASPELMLITVFTRMEMMA